VKGGATPVPFERDQHHLGCASRTATAFDCVLIYNDTSATKLALSVHTFGSQTITAGTLTLTMPTNDAKAYRHFFTDEDHAKLADVLRGSVKGKWLLSYNDDAFIRQLYRGRGITIEPLQVPYSLAGGCRKAVGELLIRNF
jgi:hypothetical protein